MKNVIEVEYYHTTSKKWFFDFAQSLSAACGELVTVGNNSLKLPPSVGEGRFEFYELTDGFSLQIVDCTFFKNLHLSRKSNTGNEIYKVVYNLSITPVIVSKKSGRVKNISDGLADAVLLSSESTQLASTFEANQPTRMVILFFSRQWFIRHIGRHSYPIRVSRMQDFIASNPIQFTTNMDLRSRQLVEEIFQLNLPDLVLQQYLAGCGKQLCAYFFNQLIEEEVTEERIQSGEAMRIIRAKEDIEKRMDQPIPKIEDVAELCFMSRTKFMTMFRSIFNEGYSTYFMKLKRDKAKDLLLQGFTVEDVAKSIGYKDTAYFTKMFLKKTGVTPTDYQHRGQ
ncbi:helix-turn-helix domain-containing protein [Taibaiella soli]|uniref:HTH araC/xylS-type domain-containing protein n=1 Tax=Taibaiella soli TaxID=1649169 RepID=A0A2W2B6D4_9BACT|nr:AraC family transcriptional regulator [Taibaiella soli]PZF71769.1 hypothetical protein DN068_17035 [Taibaiella soli]